MLVLFYFPGWFILCETRSFLVTLSRKTMYYFGWNLRVQRRQGNENPYALSELEPQY